MIAVVVGEPSPRQVVHEHARLWLGPACNLSADPAVKLIPGVEVQAYQVTCWACRHPTEATELNADWRLRRARILREAP